VCGVFLRAKDDMEGWYVLEDGAMMTSRSHAPEYDVFFCVTIGARPKVGDGCRDVHARAGCDVIGTWSETFRVWGTKVVVGGEAEGCG